MDDLYKRVIDAAEQQRGSVHCDELRDALNMIPEIPRDQSLSLRLKIADSMPKLSSPAGAGLLAIWLGASVEHGMEPGPTVEPVLRTLLRWTRTFITVDDDDLEDPDPDAEALVGSELLGQSLVAHLARTNEWREEVAGESSVVAELERVEHLTVGAVWVLELLRKRSGQIIVLHSGSPIGVRIGYENLSNCFHLFTLLQGEIADTMPGAQAVSQDVLLAATGEAELNDLSDNAWWHFGQGNVPEANVNGTVFGEASPSEIARVDGEQVMILWPPILKGRSWGDGFFAPMLSSAMPSVRVKENLSTEQVAQWREKLGLPALSP